MANLGKAATEGTWYQGCQADTPVNGLGGYEWACWWPTTLTGDSPVLAIGRCENLDIVPIADKNGDGTASTTAFDIKVCPSKLGTDAALDNACIDVPDLTNPVAINEGVMGAPTFPFYRISADGTGTLNDPLIQVVCNP